MSQLQENIDGLIAAFYLSCQSDGGCSPLSREELRQLMEREFVDAMENPQDPQTIQKVLCFLGDDSTSRVDFSELLSLVFCVAKACYKPLQQHQGPGEGQVLTAGEEQLPRSQAVGRVSHNQQVPEHGENNQDQDTETQDSDNHQIQEGETPDQDQETHQTQEGETPEQETHQDDGTEAVEEDPEEGEILDAATSEQDRNTSKAEETEETTKQDPKPHQAQDSEAPGQGSNHYQSPEQESEEQDLNSPSETQGKEPKNTQVYEAPWKDLSPDQTQQLLPSQWGASPHQDPEPQRTHHDPVCHPLPDSKVLEMEHNKAQQDTRPQRQPAVEQQLLQPQYQWPPQQ
ncbi:PREDICTED: cornulin-like [Acanthisitta chloris]|uniref:cornulin-like n=1 Tax=Acanthisitta chloris TaxID=57068 RepID=UPI0004F0C61F|nr:PREDICTED: cornulin-like [Acanthisitta chloris]